MYDLITLGNFGYILSYPGAMNYHVAMESLGDKFAFDQWRDAGPGSAKLNAKIVYPQLVKPHLKSPSDLRPQSKVDLWQNNNQPTFKHSVYSALYDEGNGVEHTAGIGETIEVCDYTLKYGKRCRGIRSFH